LNCLLVEIGVVLLLGQGLALCQDRNEQPADYFQRGIQLHQAGHLEAARREYEQALKLDPRRPEVLANIALTFRQQADYPQAIQYYQKALALDPRQNDIRYQLAVAYFGIQEFDRARDELTRVAIAQPNNYQAHHLLAICFLKLNQTSEGIRELEEVCKAQPANLSAVYTLTSAYITANELDRAETLVDLRLNHADTAEAHLIVGSYYNARKDFHKSLQELQVAKHMDPQLTGVDSLIGCALLYAGRRAKALESFENELRRNPEDFNANAYLGWLYRQDGRIAQATILLNKASRMNPDNADVLYQLALLAKSQREFEQAVDLLKRVISLKSEFLPAHMTLAQVYSRLQLNEEAQQEQAVVDRLQAEGKNQPTAVDRDLYEVLSKPIY
jgi:tetratricopeptide (TPR) repeat protein